MRFLLWFIACVIFVLGTACLQIFVPSPYDTLVSLLYVTCLSLLLVWYKKTRP